VIAALSSAHPPELQPLSQAQHDLVVYAVVVAGFALLASFLHSWNAKTEVSTRYRPAVLASLCITGIAFLSYAVLYVKVERGYDRVDGRYLPSSDALESMSTRYLDWSVTVPLLLAELLAVCVLSGRPLSILRASAMGAAFAMILTGYLGAQVFDHGASDFWLWFWFAVSCLFFVYVYVALIPVVVRSVRGLPPDAAHALTHAATVLFGVFLVYPVVYLIPVFFAGGWWTTSMHLAFSAADVIAKVLFGILVHKVAKLRTAADVVAGEDTHPEPVWVDQVHHSDAVLPVRPTGAVTDAGPGPGRPGGAR
jgi:bacteriorhodopsin